MSTIYAVTLLTIGVPNRNLRVYTELAVQRAIANSPRTIPGKIGMDRSSDDFYIDPREITHWAGNLRISEDRLVADITFNENAEGRMLEAQAARHGSYVFRTASVIPAGGIVESIVDNFTIVAVNALQLHNAA